MAKYDTVIIGAGPGGLACAKKLAENGKSVVVLEKDSIVGDKVCAGGVTAKEIQNIVPRNLVSRFFETGSVYFGTKEKKVSISVPKDSIATIDRKKLGEYMADESEKAGVEILKNTYITEIQQDHVLDTHNNRFYFNHLVGADGSNSIVRKYLKIPARKIGPTMQYRIPRIFKDIEIYFNLKNFGPYYIWIFPHDTFTEIGTGSFDASIPFSQVKKDFEAWLKGHRIDVSAAELRSFPINCDYQGFQFGNMFLIGDAAGFTDAFTGEGIYPAIISGQEAARKIIEPQYSLDKIQQLVVRKRKAEKPLRLYDKYTSLAQRYGDTLAHRLLKTKRFQKKLIDAFLY